MATVDRLQRFIADHWHPAEHARWWEQALYFATAVVVCAAIASAFSFVVPRVLVGF